MAFDILKPFMEPYLAVLEEAAQLDDTALEALGVSRDKIAALQTDASNNPNGVTVAAEDYNSVMELMFRPNGSAASLQRAASRFSGTPITYPTFNGPRGPIVKGVNFFNEPAKAKPAGATQPAGTSESIDTANILEPLNSRIFIMNPSKPGSTKGGVQLLPALDKRGIYGLARTMAEKAAASNWGFIFPDLGFPKILMEEPDFLGIYGGYFRPLDIPAPDLDTSPSRKLALEFMLARADGPIPGGALVPELFRGFVFRSSAPAHVSEAEKKLFGDHVNLQFDPDRLRLPSTPSKDPSVVFLRQLTLTWLYRRFFSENIRDNKTPNYLDQLFHLDLQDLKKNTDVLERLARDTDLPEGVSADDMRAVVAEWRAEDKRLEAIQKITKASYEFATASVFRQTQITDEAAKLYLALYQAMEDIVLDYPSLGRAIFRRLDHLYTPHTAQTPSSSTLISRVELLGPKLTAKNAAWVRGDQWWADLEKNPEVARYKGAVNAIISLADCIIQAPYIITKHLKLNEFYLAYGIANSALKAIDRLESLAYGTPRVKILYLADMYDHLKAKATEIAGISQEILEVLPSAQSPMPESVSMGLSPADLGTYMSGAALPLNTPLAINLMR